MDVVATATGFRRMFESHKLVPQNYKFYTCKFHHPCENVRGKRIHIGWDQPPVWRSSCWMVSREKSRDGFPVGVEVHRDFPEAYLDVQKLSEEAPWKRIASHGRCRTCHRNAGGGRKLSRTLNIRQRLVSPQSKCCHRGISANVRAEPSERLDAARLRRSEKRRAACDVFRGGLTTRETLSEMFTSACGVKCSKGID